ncbi:MAG TPA: vitamin K epoxide reductase family protein [Gemmatimonadales bacterium]|jgi:uncharacterized membrane protein
MRRRQAVVLLALGGLLLALYLSLYKLGLIGTLQCGTGSCEYVQTSRYAELLGMPVAFYGVVGYAALFVVGLAGMQPRFANDRRLTVLLAALSSLGLAFTLYLTYIELFVLRAVCRWCVGSAVIIAAIWALSMWGVRRTD